MAPAVREAALVIVVSHRGPARFERRADGSFDTRPGSGGLATALTPILADRDDVVWIAAALSDDDRAAARAGAVHVGDTDLRLIDLDPHTHRLHRDLVSNGTLWFLHHGLFDLVRRPRFDQRFAEAWDAYTKVNRAFAEDVAEAAPERDVVLVQDYQLSVLPGMLAAARPDLRVVHFTHTPFCGPNSIRVLPDEAATALLDGLAVVPCGFHTERWARAFEACVREVRPDVRPRSFVSSLGPDPDALAREIEAPGTVAASGELDELVGDRQLVLRADRIDPSKNIVRGFLSFDLLLERSPELRERVVFVAMLHPSRQSMPEYQAYANEVATAAARVNERWATPDWTPVVLETQDDFSRTIAGFQRYDALLVNPVKDGLNLVAKEGPLCNTRDGVVCLSPDAGSFDELADGVLSAHPYDLIATADALHRALTMSTVERARRAAALKKVAAARTPADWLGDQLSAAG